MVIYSKKQASFKSRIVRATRAGNVSQLATIANDIAKDYFARYICIDSHGSKILCWTMQGAESWLPYLSDDAAIVDSYDYLPLLARVQN